MEAGGAVSDRIQQSDHVDRLPQSPDLERFSVEPGV